MAILKGVRVNVRADGSEVVEYADDSSLVVDENEITRYIESQPNLNFELEADRDPPFGPSRFDDDDDPVVGLTFCIYIDGTLASTVILNFVHRQHIIISGARYRKAGVDYLQKFAFSEIQTTEDRPSEPKKLKSLVDAASQLGTITVKVLRISHLDTDNRPLRDREAVSLKQEVFPEKALKGSAVSHLSKLENPEVTQPACVVIPTYIDSMGKPYVTFHFKYRSRRALQIEGIVPRPASPPSVVYPVANGPLAEYSTNELRRILQQRDQVENRRTKIENRNTPGRRAGSVKREPDSDVEIISENRRGRKKVKSEVIDLSDD